MVAVRQKLSQLEHILLRPDTYIGSKCLRNELLFSILLLLRQLADAHPTYFSSIFTGIEKINAPMYIYDSASERIVQKEISYVPGLYKIFDEIVVNAADNKQRVSAQAH